MRNYPTGFAAWPEDRRNAWIAEEARAYRATRNGGADAAQRLPRPGVKGGSVSFVSGTMCSMLLIASNRRPTLRP